MRTKLLTNRAAGYVVAVLGIGATIALCTTIRSAIDNTAVALALLLVVLAVATGWGSRPALFASVLGMLGFGFFFLPPIHTLALADPEHWIAFVAFAITGVTAGQLSAWARRRTREAEAGREEVRRLARLQTVAADFGLEALGSHRARELLDRAVAVVAQTLDVELCDVMELLPGGSEFLLRAGAGWQEGRVGRATVPSLGTQPGYTAGSDLSVVVVDAATETRFVPLSQLLGEQVTSAISVVIATPEGPYGVLGVHSRRQRTFTGDEVRFLRTVANVIGSIIQQQRAVARLQRLFRARSALSNCNQALVRASDEATLLQQICQIIVAQAGYRLSWVGRAEDDAEKSVLPVAQAGFEEGYLSSLHLTWADTERGRGPTGTCIRTGKPVLAQNIATDPAMAPWRAEALKRGYAASIALPLQVDAEIFGAINIYAEEPEAFGADEVVLLVELAADMAFGIATLRTRRARIRAVAELRQLNAELEQRVEARTVELRATNERLSELMARERAVSAALAAAREREVAIGVRIQQLLLLEPPPRDLAGLRVAALTLPSQQIDGDFYGFFKHDEARFDLVVADVMGKGVPAALLAAATKSFFVEALCRLMAMSRDGRLPEPKEIVARAHADIVPELIALESFVTLCYGRFDVGRCVFDFVDCGHTGTIHVVARTGCCEMLRGGNLPLGIREGEVYDQTAVTFEPGDVFVFFSDGITEAATAAGEMFGEARLLECVRARHTLEPEALVEAIRAAVVDFSGLEQQKDDLTCVVVKVVAQPVPPARAELEIGSDLGELSRVRDFVRGVCRDLVGPALAEHRVAELVLAVDEAASNIIKHAYRGRSGHRIQIEAEALPDRLVARLFHLGEPFDPSTAPSPPLDGSRDSGFGVYLIARSVDRVEYFRDRRGRNCVELVKTYWR